MATLVNHTEWSTGRKVIFRYLFIFFGFIIFPFPLSLITGQFSGVGLSSDLWPPIVRFIGKNLFGIEQALQSEMTGSGDRLYDWVWYGVIILITIVFGTVFNLTDRKRENYNRLRSWLTFLLSYYLAYNLLLYGITKLFQMQFIPLGLDQMLETYGHSSPMHLLWTFMGASKGYTFFAGLSEVVAGVFLLFRRTRTLGAIIAFGVMLNVFVLNLCYDVPVKLFSFQLLVIAAYLISGEAQRLFSFFFLNEAVPARNPNPLFSSRGGKLALLGFQVIFISFIGISEVSRNKQSQLQYGNKRAKSELYGIYDVKEFVLNGKEVPEGLQRKSRWQRVVFDHPDYVFIRHGDGSRTVQQLEIDPTQRTINMDAQPMTYKRENGYLKLAGPFGMDTLNVRLAPYDLNRFGLRNRGFHWVSERPFNRYSPAR